MTTFDRNVRRAAPNRAGLLAVGALHVALGYAFVTGLDITRVFTPPPPPVTLKNVPLPKPVEPPPQPVDDVRIDLKAPRVDELPPPTPQPLPPQGPVITRTFDPGTIGPVALGGGGIGELPKADPVPPAAPAMTPARPRPGNGFSDDDYPAASRRNEEQGLVEVRYVIGPDGRARDCAVIASSGHPRLDEATCDRIERRFRFTPAQQGGVAVSETRTQRVRWALKG